MTEKNHHNESEQEYEVEEEGEAAVDTLKKLRARLKQAESDKQEYLTGWQRSKADFVNARKRDEETQRDLIKFAESALIIDLLPVLDSFDSAFAHEKTMSELPEEWRTGMKNIYNQLVSTLSARGLKPVTPLNETFNPVEHEAIGVMQTNDPQQDQVILDVVQKGYTLHGKSVRSARVRVGQFSQ